MTSMLVTGGLGFIGSAFVRRNLDWSSPLVNVDLGTYAGDRRRLQQAGTSIETIHLDVADPAFLELVGERSPTYIVHFAAESHVTRSESMADVFYRTNVEGTKNVMLAAERCSAELVIHVSTDEIYGPCFGVPFTEGDKAPGEGKATSAYARSKALADDIARGFSNRIPVIVVRPSNCFGPWQHPEKAIPRWIVRALRGEGLPVWGSGRQIRDWMFVEDACAAIEILLERGASGEAHNVAPMAEEMTNLETARLIAELAGAPADSVYLTEYDRPDHDVRYAIDSSKISALGWNPTPVRKGLEETLSWYRANEAWWGTLVAEAESIYSDAAVKEVPQP
ncbi:MAG: NAD-dependent epimerase/dehydratase family protein [Actinobacteria bacterium]|nr:NAD-dependent epimerase/dehydratase family protein [Actinomycetota bacterium]